MGKRNNDAKKLDEHKYTINTGIRSVRRRTAYMLLILGIIFAIAIADTRLFLSAFIPVRDLTYIYILEIAIAGYFVIWIISHLIHKLLNEHSESQARSLRSAIRISGSLIVIIIIIDILAQNPTVTVAISTVTGIIVGISMQSLIGNIIAGMVLAIVRPFKIGDMITVFSNTGTVDDIGLLYSRMISWEGKVVLVPNSTMITTTIVRENSTIENVNKKDKSEFEH